jgi:hypothetical protein
MCVFIPDRICSSMQPLYETAYVLFFLAGVFAGEVGVEKTKPRVWRAVFLYIKYIDGGAYESQSNLIFAPSWRGWVWLDIPSVCSAVELALEVYLLHLENGLKGKGGRGSPVCYELPT